MMMWLRSSSVLNACDTYQMKLSNMCTLFDPGTVSTGTFSNTCLALHLGLPFCHYEKTYRLIREKNCYAR